MLVLTDMLTEALAVACAKGVSPRLWANVLDPHMTAAKINNPRRIAAFIGQVAIESAGFSEIEEDLDYSAIRLCTVWPSRFPSLVEAKPCAMNAPALANVVYADRMGNGNETSGDGYRFRGAGLIQLTGRENQMRFADAAKIDERFVSDYLRTPRGAAQSACWFWTDRVMNPAADAWMLTSISRRINGGSNGLPSRIAMCNRVLQAIST